jgi:hypothetical protein
MRECENIPVILQKQEPIKISKFFSQTKAVNAANSGRLTAFVFFKGK